MRWTPILALLTLTLVAALAVAPTASAYCYVTNSYDVGPFGVGPTSTPPVGVGPVDQDPVHFGGASVDPVPVERQEAGVEVRLGVATASATATPSRPRSSATTPRPPASRTPSPCRTRHDGEIVWTMALCRRTLMSARRFVTCMRTIVLSMLLFATLLSAVPTASASGDCTDKEPGVGPYEVHLHQGDCMSVTYSHPTAKCSESVDVGVYSGTVVCNGQILLW